MVQGEATAGLQAFGQRGATELSSGILVWDRGIV